MMKPIADAQAFADATDADLVRRVRLFLTANRGGLSELGVWAQSGTIGLSGRVRSFYLRQMAIALAKQVAGVRRVVDDLEVDLVESGSRRARGDD